MPVSGYDKIAPFYDDLVGLVFGKDIYDAQTCFFNEIPSGANVLIIGGGTGWILIGLIKLNPCCKIWYIDSSERMIGLARNKVNENKSIVFIHGTETDIPVDVQFDTIITNFFVDSFSNEVLPSIIELIEKSLLLNGKWLVAEFVDTSKKKHQSLLWFMHVFFKWVCQHPNIRLVDWQEAFKSRSFLIVKEKDFHQGFIKSVVFSKNRGEI